MVVNINVDFEFKICTFSLIVWPETVNDWDEVAIFCACLTFFVYALEVIYGRGRFVGDFGMGVIVCVKFVSRALARGKVCTDDVAYVGILPLP